ncbi:helix-turn-helix domain-containing protein [Clostridium aciditolerans]|uniref:Transposase n=1 Tax=Clostridium aciditolerans TaxID=339861 RepID=A0A934M7J3_9CLOT|nr:helix-turn-helix domain-containing protein [Clostridium aciditolerans]MBI6875758.1 transposase [Clostridium aciditolerans]
MGRKNKISPELKIQAVLEYMNGNSSYESIARKYGVTYTPFRKWVAKYKAQGEAAFIDNGKNNSYSSLFKETVVHAYLSGEGSLQDIAIKYKIPTQDTVRQWVMKYNGHEKLKASGTGGIIMTKGRKTTYDERVEIVKYCIENKNNYSETAQKYQVSYQQVYAWTTKYEKDGVEALLDRRGKRKPEDEMSELEKLRAQNKLLEAENRRQQMEIDFLKKLDEIERR